MYIGIKMHNFSHDLWVVLVSHQPGLQAHPPLLIKRAILFQKLKHSIYVFQILDTFEEC